MGVLLEKKEICKYPKEFFQLVRSLFASRRKTIKNNLLPFLFSLSWNPACDKADIHNFCEAVLKENYLNGSERAENLKLEAFISLAKTIKNMRLLYSDVSCRKYNEN
jgi:16S rRNA A1518/A1519 N6-dimethyltransferase RsmA/KsgA/DIM1 with predicted DNA glycosylase/AP lyase activity